MRLLQKKKPPTRKEIFDEVAKIAQTVSYKPHSSWKIRDYYSVIYFELRTRIYGDATKNEEGIGELVTTRSVVPEAFVVDDKVVPDLVIRVLHSICKDAEDHERDEWFKVHGKAVYDPHARWRRC